MKESRYRPSAALIGRHNNEKLVVFGGSFENEIGDYYSTKVEIFDFEHNKWSLLSDIEYGFDCMGVCYDDCKNDCIYVGGWNSDYEGIIDIDVCKTMRYLDVEKNKWFELGQTNSYFQDYPAIWIENGFILHIASVNSSVVEFSDLRVAPNWMESKDHIVKIDKLFKYTHIVTQT
eukprot:247933_1